MPLSLSLPFVLAVAAQDVSVPPEPIPIVGTPVSVLAVAYLLPPQDPAWLTDAARFRTCTVEVLFAPEAPIEAKPLDCPEPMGAAVAKATSEWEFKAARPADTGLTRFRVDWIFRYEEKFGFTTLHAEVDPGEENAFSGMAGPPGVKLVHPARVEKEVRAKVPRKAKKRGVVAENCTGQVELDPLGGPVRVEWTTCPDSLRESAGKALTKWTFAPRVVDGVTDADLLLVEVMFK